MGSDIARYESPADSITQWRPPETVLAEAKKCAEALRNVIAMKSKPVMFNGEQYLEFEDWQTVANFYGVTAKVESTKFVEFGGVQGFEAVAIAIDREGNEVGRAESMCLNDEPNWGPRTKYKWVDETDENGKKIWDAQKRRYKAKKVEDGSEPTPLFQLRSMAQTRACAKALRQKFSWVVVLAGYKPTVAEEMTGEPDPHQQAQQQPNVQKKSQRGKQEQAPPAQENVMCNECRVINGHDPNCPTQKKSTDTTAAKDNDAKMEAAWNAKEGHDPAKHINWKQAKLLFVIKKNAKISDDALALILKNVAQTEHTSQIAKESFAEVLDALDPEFEYHEAPREY